MLNSILVPNSLKIGDTVRIIAPSRSLSIIDKPIIDLAEKRLVELGLNVTYGKNVYNLDDGFSSKIKDRLNDLNEAYLDTQVKAIFTAIGGYNSNQLLDEIDFDIIKKNPKILCGFSDITVLLNAIFSKTRIVTFLGPHFSSLGMEAGIDYTISCIKNILFNISNFTLQSSAFWSDDLWYKDQINRNFIKSKGPEIVNKGQGEGYILGGNMGSLNLLRGTEYLPYFEKTILVLEVEGIIDLYSFERELLSYHHLFGNRLKGIIIGRFQMKSNITTDDLRIITTKHFKEIPIISNVDIGHTQPIGIVPIGVLCTLNTLYNNRITFDFI